MPLLDQTLSKVSSTMCYMKNKRQETTKQCPTSNKVIEQCRTEEQWWSRQKWASLRAWLYLVSCPVVLASCVFVFFVFFPLLLLAFCPRICKPGSPLLKQSPHLLPPTSLCSGDSPEQRSAAAWQRASTVPSLSGDHQWDLHPCTCAKLARGHPQSHTCCYGVCVASPILPHPFWTSFTCSFIHPSYCHVWLIRFFVHLIPSVFWLCS